MTAPVGTGGAPSSAQADHRRPPRWRMLVLLALVLAAGAGATAELGRAWSAGRVEAPVGDEPRVAAGGSADPINSPRILFRSERPGADFGRLSSVPVAAPSGPRTRHPQTCDRVHARADRVVCLALQPGISIMFTADLMDSALRPVGRYSVDGVPSRARLSADGGRLATTAFVTGHGYSGSFSTRTGVIDLTGGAAVPDLESFTVTVDGELVRDSSLNVWGVTFDPGARPDGFYATVKVDQQTWLVRGSLVDRTLRAIRGNVECPSVSPDGRILVYKSAGADQGTWRLRAFELQTNRDWALPETRSVDDQVEWLDNQHVLYGLQRSGTTTQHADIWVSGLESGRPRVLIPDAWSPAVVQPPA